MAGSKTGLAHVWQVFNEYEIAGYVANRRLRKPVARKRLRQLLYLR